MRTRHNFLYCRGILYRYECGGELDQGDVPNCRHPLARREARAARSCYGHEFFPFAQPLSCLSTNTRFFFGSAHGFTLLAAVSAFRRLSAPPPSCDPTRPRRPATHGPHPSPWRVMTPKQPSYPPRSLPRDRFGVHLRRKQGCNYVVVRCRARLKVEKSLTRNRS